MRLGNLGLRTQLRLGFGVVLLMVALLGALAWFHADRLWLELQGLHDHPLTVRRALHALSTDVFSIQLGMKELTLEDDEQARQAIIQDIAAHEANALQQLDVLHDRYLGPTTDVDRLRVSLAQWKSIREETFRLLRDGRMVEAAQRTRDDGAGGGHARLLEDSIQKISDFAKAKGDQFYDTAKNMRDRLQIQLWAALAVIFAVAFGVGYLLLRGILGPLRELTDAAESFRQGKLTTRCRYASDNEAGMLAATFNSLAETVEAELRSRESVANISAVMAEKEDPHAFGLSLLQCLLEYTGAQVGAIYLLNEQKTEFEHFDSIGLASQGRGSFSPLDLEGEFGAVLVAKRIQRLRDIPGDTRFTFRSVAGDFLPREILTIPILAEGATVAVVSLASVKPYPDPAIRLIDDLWPVMTARMNSVIAFMRLQAQARQLEHQNQELDSQKRELAAQKDELAEQNVELEMQKRELGDANRMKSTFLSSMSHELRTPLNSVIALSGVLSRRLAGTIPEEEARYLDVIERNGKNLLALINNVLDLSRIEAGREEVSLSSFAVRDLVAEIVDMIAPQAQEKGLALINDVDKGLPILRSDLVKCRHILQNLVGNAVKFTEKGRVAIDATVAEDELRIAVSDTGIGIPADKIEYIFEEFRQADESTTRNYGGSGLGLSIARKYAALLGGRVDVQSTLGKGSTFTLTLPLCLTESLAETPPPEYVRESERVEPESIPDGRGKCILVVEDNEPSIVQLKDILAGQGYTVLVAHNGREALDQVAKTVPDAMILDLMMPEVDGFEVLKAVRNWEKTASLPVLILTAKHVTRDELSFLKGNHVRQLIQKGDIDRVNLLAAIGKMVAPPPSPRATERKDALREAPARRPVVLVVEDNPDNMLTVRALLRDSCVVIEASDGESGVRMALEHKPDLVLMDISLPKLDGIQAFRAIRNHDELNRIPVIALTASAMKGSREDILAHGFDAYIAKPIDYQVLERTTRAYLGLNSVV